MDRSTRTYFLRFIFTFIFVAPSFFCQAFAQTSALPIAKKAVLDLRKVNLKDQIIPLNGEWSLYWKKLISSTDTSVVPTAFVVFPKLWTNTNIEGLSLPHMGFASYSLTVLLPKQANDLALEIPDTYSSYRLFINGKEFANAGNPDSVKEKDVPKWLTKTLKLPDTTDTLYLVLHVSNYLHSKGGPYKEILIGPKDKLFHNKELDTAFDLLLTGCLFMGGLFFFGLFLFGRHDKSILYFSLFAMTYSYRIFGTRLYVLHTIFPDIPWTVTIHLEYLTLFISLIFFELYTYHLYPKESNKYVNLALFWSCLILSAIVLIFPPAVFTQLINPFLIVMFAVIGYTFYVYFLAMRRKRIGAGYAMLSTGVVLLVFVVINLQYFGIINAQKGILFAGYMSFFFLQSLILSFRFAHILKKAKLQAEQALTAKSEFLSTMSHEIRTPLNSILGMTQLILGDNPNPEHKEQLKVLLFSANNLLAIVNDILDYNKIEAGKVNFESIEIDLPDIVKNIISGLRTAAEEKKIELKLHIDPSLQCKITGDPTRIGQVINNLVSNAIKFTRKGYVLLDIHVDNESDKMITLTIRVEDTGIGIAQEKQKIIFEQFTQADTTTSRNFGGTGLGLAICKKLLELQGCSLQLISEAGKGSVFYFTQTFIKATSPVVIPQPISSLMPSETSRPLSGISILLVEDNETNILVTKTFLERWGATIDVAVNGEEALQVLDIKRHKLILMDMHMPVMDGYNTTIRMRENGVRIPIVALSASLPAEIEHRAKDIGIDDIIVKPFVDEDLYRIVLHYTGVYPSSPLK